MMKTMNDLFSRIKEAETIAVGGHIRPDGDCVGSCVALYLYLKKNYPDKKVSVYLDHVPQEFLFLTGTDEVVSAKGVEACFDLFISLDCGDLSRLGDAQALFEQAKDTISLDHHITNEMFAKTNLVEADRSSTSEFLYEFLEPEKIDKDIASALYTGIIFDTGVFRHSNTSRRTMEIAGKLMEYGIEHWKIIDGSFDQKTYIQNQILGRCLLESILVLNGSLIVSCVTQKTLDFYEATSDDLDGVVDQLRTTKGVEVALLIYETGVQEYKVSMRSNGAVDVSKIGAFFGGGGHKKAAGCTMHGSFYDVINNLTEHIEEQLLTIRSADELN